MIKKMNTKLQSVITRLSNFFTYKKTFLTVIDFILFGLIFYLFCNHLLIIVYYIIDYINNLYNFDSIISYMTSNTPNTANTGTTGTTTTQVIHSSEGWSSAIKSIFIYGTGGMRLYLLRGGTPFQRTFIIGSTTLADAATTALKNAINDPEYVEKHLSSWKRILKDGNLSIDVSDDPGTDGKFGGDSKKNFLPDIDSEYILNYILDHLKALIEPVSVPYSNEILANQIHGISIILFILSLATLILLIFFIINIVILIHSDKLMSLFSNKYIRAYIAFNKKIIGIELILLGGSLVYFMYMLSYGIHFIATHPIILS
jgi:hypothetical protein